MVFEFHLLCFPKAWQILCSFTFILILVYILYNLNIFIISNVPKCALASFWAVIIWGNEWKDGGPFHVTASTCVSFSQSEWHRLATFIASSHAHVQKPFRKPVTHKHDREIGLLQGKSTYQLVNLSINCFSSSLACDATQCCVDWTSKVLQFSLFSQSCNLWI